MAYNGVEALTRHLEAKDARKRKVAKNAQHGMPTFSEETAELKAEMAAPGGFHTVCRERDRVCADCQNYHGRTRKAGQHADHTIPQGQASREEKTNPVYGCGCCAECNKLRDKKIHRACMVKDGEMLYQVRWCPDLGICKRRLMSDPPGAWFDWEKPDYMKDGNLYVV